jgi:hypothetical protein
LGPGGAINRFSAIGVVWATVAGIVAPAASRKPAANGKQRFDLIIG